MQRLGPSDIFAVSDPSAAGEVRRAAVALAAGLGFDETEQGNVAIVAAELTRNVVTHARAGEVLLREAPCGGGAPGVELLALDKGPGMSDVARCMRDGYSTAGTAGIGLGAVRRLSWLFDVYSTAGNGTAVLARVGPRAASSPAAAPALECGVVQVAKTGEQLCGDACAIGPTGGGGGAAFVVADGLGHGPMAHQAASEAVRVFAEYRDTDAVRLMGLMDSALRPTRGAAVSVVYWDPSSAEARFVGVGNVSATLVADGATRSMAAHNGTVGHSMRKVQQFTYAWPSEGVLVMCSDGLGTQWQISKYPGLWRRHPALLAGVLFRDFNRGRDDVTVLAARVPTGGAGGGGS